MTAAIQFGEVAATLDHGNTTDFPSPDLSNEVGTVPDENWDEQRIKFTAASGTEAGNGTITLYGSIALPASWTGWEPHALRVRTQLEATGVAVSSTGSVALKVVDPLDGTSYAATQTRSLSESGNALSDGSLQWSRITAGDLDAAGFRPGMLLRFEIVFTMPKTFTALTLRVGRLEIGWR